MAGVSRVTDLHKRQDDLDVLSPDSSHKSPHRQRALDCLSLLASSVVTICTLSNAITSAAPVSSDFLVVVSTAVYVVLKNLTLVNTSVVLISDVATVSLGSPRISDIRHVTPFSNLP